MTFVTLEDAARLNGENLPAVVPEQTTEPAQNVEPYDENNPNHVSLLRLWDILGYRRMRGSVTEAAFLERFIDSIPGIHSDLCGNRYVCIGDPSPTVMWSCHYDTCHGEEGQQQLVVDGEFIALPETSTSSCLGADDGAGIWLMLEMIDAGVPGLYIFHYGEESGCIGSRWLVQNTPHLVEGIQAAIAFDRAGYTDVITHQMTGRCCSDNFAKSLAKLLLPGYKPDDGGVYTDTAHYIGLIPECTNISVGYFRQHTDGECVNFVHLLELRAALVAFDASQLVIERDPTVIEDDFGNDWGGYFGTRYGTRYRGSYGSNSSRGAISSKAYDDYGMIGENDEREFLGAADLEEMDDDQDWNRGLHRFSDSATPGWQSRRSSGARYRPRSLAELLERYPDDAAEVLENYGIDVDQLWDEIEQIKDGGRH